MPSEITKILLRKGTDIQRQSLVLSEAELGYTTDTTRLYVGDGSTYGGNPIGVKNWGVVTALGTLATLPAEIGDIVYYNSKLYSLTANPPSIIDNWAVTAGAGDGSVTSVEVGDFLNIDGNPNVKSFTDNGAITLEVNNLFSVMYPVGSLFLSSVPYVNSTTSTSVFTYLGQPGQFALTSGQYQMGVWNYIGSDPLATITVYMYQRVS